MKTFIICGLVALTAACTHGTKVEQYPPAVGPEGAKIAVRVTGEKVDRIAELLAADSTGITLLDTNIFRVAWTRVSAIDVDVLRVNYDVRFGEKVTPAKIAQLALLSRFPQGLNGDLLAAVLRTRNQSTLEIIQ